MQLELGRYLFGPVTQIYWSKEYLISRRNMSNIGCILKFVSKTGFLIMLDTMAMAFFSDGFQSHFYLQLYILIFFYQKF